jgi:photosystem II stability/assembly factor-like uncharacterized protein
MKRIIALVIISFLAQPALASNKPLPSVMAPLATNALLLDIIKPSPELLLVVGEHGHILTSSDAKQWQQAQVPLQSTLTRAYFVNPQLGWVVGHDASILHSKDGGLSWQIQQFLPELEKPLFDIIFKNSLEGIAVGAYGQFFRTIDGGKHWQFEFHQELLHPDDLEYLEELKQEDEQYYLDERSSILPHFNRILRDGKTLYLVGEIGFMATSTDFGVSWKQQDEIYQGSFFDLAKTPQGGFLVAGLRGNAFVQTSPSAPWQRSKTDTTALINAIVVNGQRMFLLGNNGVLLETRDNGNSYQQHLQPDGKALIDGVLFDGKIIAVSDVGIKTIELMK